MSELAERLEDLYDTIVEELGKEDISTEERYYLDEQLLRVHLGLTKYDSWPTVIRNVAAYIRKKELKYGKNEQGIFPEEDCREDRCTTGADIRITRTDGQIAYAHVRGSSEGGSAHPPFA